VAVKAHPASGHAIDNEIDGAWMLLPPSPGSTSISGDVKVHEEGVEGFVGTTTMQPDQNFFAANTPLSGSVREVPAVEDEIESAVGIITTSLTLRTSSLRLKDIMATLIGKAIKDEARMHWPFVQP